MSESSPSLAENATPAAKVRQRSPKHRLVVAAGVLLFTGLIVALLLLSFNRVSERVNADGCARDLHFLGLTLQQYAAEHANALPADWADLASNAEVTPQVFLCPDDFRDGPAPGTQPADWSSQIDRPPGSHCAYAYAAGPTLQNDPNVVLAFERAGGHRHFGVNVLFSDAHVETLPPTPAGEQAYSHLQADFTAGVRPLRLRP